MKKPDVPEIVQAALTIEQDLKRLEELSRSVQGTRLNNEKNIGRAGRTLQEALQQQEQLAASLRVLGEAMQHMQQRQQVAVEVLGARALDIQQQANRLADHMERFAALGTKAAEATQLLQDLPPPYGSGSTDAATVIQNGGPAQTLAKIETLLLALADEAKALAASADDADLSELSKEAGSLRQRIDSARGRIAELARNAQQQAN